MEGGAYTALWDLLCHVEALTLSLGEGGEGEGDEEGERLHGDLRYWVDGLDRLVEDVMLSVLEIENGIPSGSFITWADAVLLYHDEESAPGAHGVCSPQCDCAPLRQAGRAVRVEDSRLKQEHVEVGGVVY